MARTPKSTTLYKTPFSAAYWRDAAAELKDTKMLVFAALMIALRVALKLVYIPLAPNLKINTAFLANAMGAMVYGPVVATLAAAVSDFLGVLITGDVYFPPFILTEIAGSLIFSLFLYRARITPTRVMLSRFCICLFVNILLQTPLMMLYYQVMMGGKTYVLTVPHILKNLFMFPIESVVLTIFLAFIQPITYRMKLTYNKEASLHFEKKQIAMLVVLFVFGCGCVTGYLSYYYETNSLSASYTAQERYEANTRMTEVLCQQNGDYADKTLVTTVESAYQKFLGDTTTYNVVVYAVDDEALAGYDKDLETIRGMSKSKAKAVAEDGVMERVAEAVIVLNKNTGETISCEIQ